MTSSQLQDWAGDIVALESHIEEALDHQLKLDIDNPELKSVIQKLHDTCRDSKGRAEAFQLQVGSTSGNPVIKAGTELLGKAAGVLDRMRSDAVSKALRDDYTAMNHLCMAYTMFLSTAKALGDEASATFAEEGLTTYAGLIQDINHAIPVAVVHDLEQNADVTNVNITVTEEIRGIIDRVWKATS